MDLRLAVGVIALFVAGAAAAQEGARALAPEEVEAPPEPVLTRPPKLLKFVEATYPPEAFAAKKAASVTLIVTIDADGFVSEATPKDAADPDGFVAAALEAVMQFEFRPAHMDHKPAPVRIEYTYNFEVKIEAPEPIAPIVVVGTVNDAERGTPLEGAKVSAGEVQVVTDAEGGFSIEVPPGTPELTAEAIGRKAMVLPVMGDSGETVMLDFELRLPNAAPDEIVVKGARLRGNLTKRSIDKRVLRSVPGTFGDPVRVVQNLPGVARAPFVVGVLLVRGAGPGDSAVMVDGHEVPLLFHFLGGPSVVPPDMLAGIDYYPGNFTTRFGRKTGGVIDVRTRRPDAKEWRGSADVDLFDAGLYLEGPLGDRTTISVSGRRSYIDGVIAGVNAAADENLVAVFPAYYDYQLRLDHRLGGGQSISALVFGSHDTLSVTGSSEDGEQGPQASDIDASIGFHRLKVDWTARSKGFSSRLSPVIGVDLTRFDTGTEFADATVLEYALREDLRWEVHDDVVWIAGLDGLGRSATLSADVPLLLPDYRPYPGATILDNENNTLERSITQISAAAFSELEWSPFGGPLLLTPGVRTDAHYYSDEIHPTVDPRITARLQLNPDWVLKAGAGRFSQPPRPWRLDEDFGNPDLDPELAEHYGAGFEWQLTEAINLDMQGFFIYRHNLVQRTNEATAEASNDDPGDDDFFASANTTVSRFENQGEARSYGLEVMLKHAVTKRFYGWIAYTLSKAEEFFPGEGWRRFIFDQTHNLVVVGSYRFGQGWEAGVRFRLVSGNPVTPVEGANYDADWTQHRPLQGKQFSERQSPFNQLDIRIEKQWVYPSWQLALYFDVQNTYFATNPEFTLYDYRFRESVPVPGVPILPTFGLRGSF